MGVGGISLARMEAQGAWLRAVFRRSFESLCGAAMDVDYGLDWRQALVQGQLKREPGRQLLFPRRQQREGCISC